MTERKRVAIRSDNHQPDWVCQPCGAKHGVRPDRGMVSTYHAGTCGACGRSEVFVTEPRDFGYLRRGWQQHEKAAP